MSNLLNAAQLKSGDNFAGMTHVPRIRLNDQVPGAKIEIFSLPTGGLFFVMRIATGTPTVAPRLVIRCDESGDVFAAIAKAEALASGSG